MVNYCANPGCNRQLHYLRDGKVFLFSSKNAKKENATAPRPAEHFWLCGNCAKVWTLSLDRKDTIQLVGIGPDRVRGVRDRVPVPAA